MMINLIQIKKISVKNMYFSSNAKRNEFSLKEPRVKFRDDKTLYGGNINRTTKFSFTF